jgi:dTDP-4-amino-4,6-dideoxygalactose transaminase
MINVTKPFLPPLEDFAHYAENIWQRNWLTNNGPLVNELELKLKDYLEVPHLLYLCNGTVALQIAIKALNLKGEIITTPFSYVATTSSIVWEGCTPVFVDIDPETLNIDSSKIEAAITLRTSGILATHVYGNPCDIEAIDIIAKKHNLKVIYDAAHGFGTKYKAKSIFAYGDVSTTSFHATKLFHTVEGGAVMTQNPEILKRMAYMRNFGHDGYDRFNGVGINGKNSEFHAAIGLAILPYMHEILRKRRELTEYYNRTLVSVNRQLIKLQPGAEYNYAYYPVILPSEQFLLNVVEELNKNWIYPRRYFYPSLSELPYVKRKHECPVCEDIARRILCLPLYHTLTFEEIDLIARLMLRAQNY